MMTFLDLVNAFITETGINGGRQLTSVAAGNNSPESKKVVAWVADADYRIQAMFNDWSFLYRQFNSTVAAASGIVVLPTFETDRFVYRRIDRESLVLNPGTVNAYRPRYQDWKEFRAQWLTGTRVSSNYPQNFTIRPDGQLYLSSTLVDATPYTIEGWAKPYRMKSNGDTSPIVRGMASHSASAIAAHSNPSVIIGSSSSSLDNNRDIDGRPIIVRAKIIYAEAEGAIEVMQGALSEWEEIVGQLQAMFLPGQDDDLSSETDNFKQIVTP
jgi:hypothetical protein